MQALKHQEPLCDLKILLPLNRSSDVRFHMFMGSGSDPRDSNRGRSRDDPWVVQRGEEQVWRLG